MKVLLITSGQPSINPRLVKEADALADAGHTVEVLYSYWNIWATNFDKALLHKKKWKAIRIGGDPNHKPFSYFFSRLIHKLAIIGAKKLKLKYFAESAISRSSYMLMRKACEYTADIYIAHNLGALPAAIKAAKLHNKPCGFDAEDFHRNEVSNDLHNFDVMLKAYVESKYIPQTSYLTASSPQIAAAYSKLFPSTSPVCILNVFNRKLNINVNNISPSSPLKLFWFSQTVGTGRGLEHVIEAINSSKFTRYELHLLGHIQDDTTKDYFEKLLDEKRCSLYFHNPIAPDELIAFSSQFDIGLATENNIPLNRDICLTNKIFTYMQGGLAIIASNTTAQSDLLKNHPEIGKLYEISDVLSLSKTLLYYSANRDILFKAKQASLHLAHIELNWEKEQSKFLKIIQQILIS